MSFNLDWINHAMREGAHEGLLEAAELVKEEAIKLMPKDDPQAEREGSPVMAENVNITPTPAGVIVSVDVPYAAKQNFDLRLHHPRGGGPHFLDNALKTLMPRLEGIIAGKVDGNMKRGHR